MTGPLAGIRVIDVSEGAQGPWAGALLADLGADVIKVEKPEGERMRRGSPSKLGRALPHAGLNHGKRNIVLDLKEAEDREVMYDLVRSADVLLENWRRGVSERLDLDYETLSGINPRLIYASASGFGVTGKYAHKATVDFVSQAMGGYFSFNGPKGGPAERPRFIVIDLTSPLTVVQAIILGLIGRQRSGWGQWVRCSQLETLMSISQVRASEYFASGKVPQPLGSEIPYVVPSQAFRTADTHIIVDCPTDGAWQALAGVLHLGTLAIDPRFVTNADRVEHRVELIPLLAKAFVRFTAKRWLVRLQEAGVPCSHVTWDIEDLYEDPQVVQNNLLVKRELPSIGWVRTNEVPWLMSGTPATYGALASTMDQDRDSILADIQDVKPVAAPTESLADHRPPLVGLRVLDLTLGDGAPYAAMQLGDAGADVIKIEPPSGDWARHLGGPFDHGDGPLFMGMNRSKRSIAVDLEQQEGQRLVRELAEKADVLVHSFPKAADAARLGLDYDTLAKANPRLIYCDISVLEREGSEADRPATDLTVQARVGLPRFLGTRGEEPLRFGTNYAGITASLYAVQAILAAVYSREESGRGQQIQTSYLRAMIATQTNYFCAFSDAEDADTTTGFHTWHLEPPSRGIETLDQPVIFSLGNGRDPDLRVLLQHLEVFDRFSNAEPEMAARFLGPGDLPKVMPYVRSAMKTRTSAELLDMLEKLGLMSAPVHDLGSLFRDDVVSEQEMMITLDHPTRGTVTQVGLPWKLRDTPAVMNLAPPTLGEHTDEILRGAGFDDARIETLRRQGVVR